MTVVAFYKHDIAKWRGGTVALSDRAYRVYHVIIEEIMLNEGPVPLHERSLAGKANRSVRDFRAALDELVTFGKVSVRDGFVHNSRAETELKSIRDNRENAANGGRKSGEVRQNINDLKGCDEAPLHSATKPKRDREREEKKEIEPSVLCPKPVRTQYPADFENFWSLYPTDQNMSKKQALKVWQRLPADERQKAIASLPAYRAYCHAHPDYRPKHAEGYLSQAKYDGHLAAAQKIASRSFYVERGTPQWTAWDAYYRKTKGSAPPTDARGGWSFPTEWPPQENAA